MLITAPRIDYHLASSFLASILTVWAHIIAVYRGSVNLDVLKSTIKILLGNKIAPDKRPSFEVICLGPVTQQHPSLKHLNNHHDTAAALNTLIGVTS